MRAKPHWASTNESGPHCFLILLKWNIPPVCRKRILNIENIAITELWIRLLFPDLTLVQSELVELSVLGYSRTQHTDFHDEGVVSVYGHCHLSQLDIYLGIWSNVVVHSDLCIFLTYQSWSVDISVLFIYKSWSDITSTLMSSSKTIRRSQSWKMLELSSQAVLKRIFELFEYSNTFFQILLFVFVFGPF